MDASLMLLDVKKFEKIELGSIGSTNDYAKELAKGGVADYAFVRAVEQIRGRTTKKDSPWFSPPGNLYFTALVRLSSEEARYFSRLSFITALSVVETVLEIANEDANIVPCVKIKWPNDVLINVKKACGILIEKEGPHAIIGVGLNVAISPASGSVSVVYPTTSLAGEGIKSNVAAVAQILGSRLVDNINGCKLHGFASIIEKVLPFMYKIGERVCIEFAGRQIEGLFEGLDNSGGIIIAGKNEKTTLLSGEMTKENFI